MAATKESEVRLKDGRERGNRQLYSRKKNKSSSA